MMKSILMKNTVAGIILALIAMTVYGCDQKKKTCEEKDAVTCHIVEKHIPASDVLYLKAYPLSASYQTSKDTIILGYNYRSHALDVIDCRTDSVREIRFEKEGNNAVTGRLAALYVHNMDSIWIYSESMQAYLVDQTGSIRQKLNLNDYLQDGEELLLMNNHAVCTSRLYYDALRGTLLYGIVNRNSSPCTFKVCELDLKSLEIVNEYSLQASLADKDVSSGYANMNNAVNIAFHDSLIVYNYPIESHIYVLNRLTGSFRALEADSRYTKNCAEKCLSKDYSLWERHQIENPHFFDVMYLSEVGIYARLHLGGVAYRQDTDLGQLSDSRSLYVSFYDTDFHKLGEQMLPERRYSYYTGWCGMNDGILLFVDNAQADYDFSEDLYVDKVYPVKTGLKTE